MDILSTIFSLVLGVFIVSMMLAAGLSATIASLGQVFRRFWLVILVLLVNFVLIPLLGWGVAELFALATPAFIAMVLVACSPGAPFGVKPAVTSGGDVVTASSLQILMAALGSFTFPFTANWILSAANLGEDISLPVGRLVGTVVVLQIVPFIVGMAMRNWAPQTAGGWLKASMSVSGIAFFAVLALALLGGWQEIVDLIGSRTMLASIVLAVIALALGIFIAAGSGGIRTTVGLLAPNRNAGPVFAAIGIAFANDPSILGAATAIMLIGTVISILFASFLARRRAAPVEAPASTAGGSELVSGAADMENAELD
jgi:BASS family bile acid:Na+ symporter